MGFREGSLRVRARLDMEKLEDRTVPANLDAALTAALPEVAATVTVVGDRVNVVMAAETTTAADTAAQIGVSNAPRSPPTVATRVLRN